MAILFRGCSHSTNLVSSWTNNSELDASSVLDAGGKQVKEEIGSRGNEKRERLNQFPKTRGECEDS